MNQLLKYLRYYFTAKNRHGIHSPFIFNILDTVLYQKKVEKDFAGIEKTRKQLLKNNQVITVTDFGAGSRVFSSNKRAVKKIAKTALKKAKYGQLFYRVIKKYNCKVILELGTCFGITTQYLAKASPNGKIYSLEGCPETLKVAQKGFNANNVSNIEAIVGNFDDSLPQLLSGLPKVDFAFIDGNHQKAATEKYFLLLLEKSTDSSIFIFDDIHWSKEMETAWKSIKEHEKVTATIDLFFVGIVFFKKGLTKQHFTIRY